MSNASLLVNFRELLVLKGQLLSDARGLDSLHPPPPTGCVKLNKVNKYIFSKICFASTFEFKLLSPVGEDANTCA